MKPSRSASNGRLAVAGSSLRVDSAFMEAKPPTPIGVMVASVPPQIIISAAPRSIILNESPMACAEAEQAVAVAELGPRAPYRIETWPEARFTIAEGIKNGEIFPGPPCTSFQCSRSMMSNPPMLDETAHFLQFFFLNPPEGVEVLHLPGDGAVEAGGIEKRNRSDPVLPGDQI